VFLNSRHAMLETENKQLHVDIEQVGSATHVRISDTGIGIPEKDIPHLFNPFFTTKGEFAEPGSPSAKVKGTGLGLSVSHTIVVKHHGDILVDSVVGEGTTFTIVLPIVVKPTPPKPVVVKTNRNRENICRGNMQRILVLDDEEEIGRVVETILKANGYDPLCMLEGEKALGEHKIKPFDVVIVDLQMPDMTGQVFLDKLNELPNPPEKIVLTGLARVGVGDELDGLGIDSVIQKPFDMESILLAVQKCVLREEADG